MKTPAILATFALACACADPPLVEAPGARAVAVARTADALALVELLARAKLVDASALTAAGPALVADAPAIASFLPSGAVVVATRVGAGASALAASARPVVGKTSAIALGGETALVRVDGNRALIALHVPAGDEATLAAMLELLAATKDARVPLLPAAGVVDVHVAAAALPVPLGDINARISVSGDTVDVRGEAPTPSADVHAAFALPPPAWACALTDGAAASLAIPPLSAELDSFKGPVVLALSAGPSFALAGTPADDKAAASLEATLTGATVVALDDGGRAFTLAGKKRTLRAVSGHGIFAVAVGDASLAHLADAKCTAPPHLLSMRGKALAAVVGPALVDPREIVRALLAGEPTSASTPLTTLRGIDRLDVDARANGAAISFTAHLVLAPD